MGRYSKPWPVFQIVRIGAIVSFSGYSAVLFGEPKELGGGFLGKRRDECV
jgi:hypothetical protein